MHKIIFIIALLLSGSLLSQQNKKDSAYVVLEDDPILAMIDSMMASGYYESLGFNDNVHKKKKYNYAIDSIPVFDSITYAKRFQKLNAHSPFSLVYNNYVRGYVDLYAK
ncbi:MAG: hypothetical protein GW818_05615, partial [Flavobacteriales bacterium]|nr:hypothetical protein [Flavobacteriales bacterium]